MKTTSHATKHRSDSHWLARIVRWSVILVMLSAGVAYMTYMPDKSWSAPAPPLTDEEQLIRDKLKQHVETLAQQIGERNVWQSEALLAAASYIRDSLEDLGYRVQAQSFESEGVRVQNLEVEISGDVASEEIIVLGAHYDSVVGTPGANDNASGVAALLEIARLSAGKSYPRTLRLVAFANEEPPFFYSDAMGSRVYAERSRQRGDEIKAMIALETIGYYTDQADSQKYPFPFKFFYPDTANFIGFVGNLSSRRLLQQSLAAFRASTAFPSEGVAAPGWVMGVGWSDHWSFWQAGFPAIMVTDTALFRYRHYHAPTDTPDKLDYPSLARVTRGLANVAAGLAGASRIQ